MSKETDFIVSADWHDASEVLEEITEKLEELGVYVYDMGEGGDGYEYLFSKRKMTKREARKIYNQKWKEENE